MTCPKCTMPMVRSRRPKAGVVAPNPNAEAHWVTAGLVCHNCGHVVADTVMDHVAAVRAATCRTSSPPCPPPADVDVDVRVDVTLPVAELSRIVGEAAYKWAPAGMRVDDVEFVVNQKEELDSAVVTFKPIKG